MILQKLCEYYDAHQKELPDYGFEIESISFCLVIDKEGYLVEVEDIREHTEKKPRSIRMMVPGHSKKRTSGIRPHLLWDNVKYVLGINDEKGYFESFKDFHERFKDSTKNPLLEPLCKFLEQWNPRNWKSAVLRDGKPLPYKEDLVRGPNVVFRLEGEKEYLHEKEGVRDLISLVYGHEEGTKPQEGRCLITGERKLVPNRHPKIKNIEGAKAGGNPLVSCNSEAFNSYGKEDGFNAPVSIEAAFKYTAATSHLAAQEPKFLLGDIQVLFWTDQPLKEIELLWGFTLKGEEALKIEEEKEREKFKLFFSAILQGKMPETFNLSLKYYVLGIAPHSGRLAVRFWDTNTIETLLHTVRQHYADISLIKHTDKVEDFPSLHKLISSLIPLNQQKNRNQKNKNKNPIPGPLRVSVFRSFLSGLPYPPALLQLALNRIRIEKKPKDEGQKAEDYLLFEYYRMCLIKGYLARWQRIKNHQQEVTMALDPTHPNTAYRLGRLFAVLEKAQKEALGEVNSTIKDRFFSSASTTPKRVFPYLIRLSQHHLAKVGQANVGRKVNLEKTIQEILHGIDDFPAFLPLEEQGMFALGYYHQRQALFQSKE
ncbi:type I-C CRISPR-associated protein Cas8c/Csd1 [Spirochaeta thermophila]|uniref:type I-C CRISPR-associated protein Cas8c/Csd1 n=1 Tax=Winmispira thermophila TaxID=154 RepID=UPI0002FAF0D8|nr:type I-C CRISPR-associated protein Cas8c/Csd1 [Spirochaeta thermophila]